MATRLLAGVFVAGAALLGGHLAAAVPLLRVQRFGVLEQSFRFSTSVANRWEQVRLDVQMRAPDGRTVGIGGFYAGGGAWKFRLAPTELGRWSWTARIADRAHAATHRGTFQVVPGPSPGFVRQSPYNRYRWTFTNGRPFDAIGLQDCTVAIYTDNPLTGFGFDGGQGTPPRWTSLEPYLTTFAAAGFDLFRWGPNNCSFALYDRIAPAGNVYSQQGGAYADQLLRSLRRHGFRVEFVLFGGNPPFPSGADPAGLAAVERYVRYAVDRYGALVDFWELMNETTVSTGWYDRIVDYLRAIDPYHHPIGTSWSRPELPGIGFGSDHWYETEPDLDADRVAWQHLRSEPARRYGKPTLVDEQGNSGHNWDPGSAVRMRLRAWTAFFAEATLVFWNTSATKDYAADAANIYLGPEERSYVRVLARYVRGFDPRARVVTAAIRGETGLRAYALRGPHEYGLYVVDGAGHSEAVSSARVAVDPVHAGRAVWTDPATGRTLASLRVRAGRQSLAIPPFATDVALKIS
jgi:Domain of unknown function (DUF5060)